MAETTRRVNVTLTAATEEDAHQVMAGVLDAVRNTFPALAIEATSTHAFDLSEPARTEPVAYLVIADEMVQVAIVGDIDAASSAASACQGVVAELPLTFDYSRKETR